ncbi:hypothetical protein J6590_067602 [Homalodisca vitripennis]|nr:hypothetical protein J6590_067602 [Homalodisca vitripennis]
MSGKNKVSAAETSADLVPAVRCYSHYVLTSTSFNTTEKRLFLIQRSANPFLDHQYIEINIVRAQRHCYVHLNADCPKCSDEYNVRDKY